MLMKRKVHYSWYCIVMTFVVMVLFCIGIVTVWGDAHSFPLLVVMAVVAAFMGLYYCPVSVRADSDGVRVCRLMSRARVFPYSDIESVETCYPSAGGNKIVRERRFLRLLGLFQRYHDRAVFRLLCRPWSMFLHQTEERTAICGQLR